MCENADGATNLAYRDGFPRARETLPITPHLVIPERECQAEGSWLGMDAVRPPDLRSIFEFDRPALQHLHQLVDFFQQNVAGVAQQQRVRGVNDI